MGAQTNIIRGKKEVAKDNPCSDRTTPTEERASAKCHSDINSIQQRSGTVVKSVTKLISKKDGARGQVRIGGLPRP